MAQDGLKQLFIDGIHAVQGAANSGKNAASMIESNATHSDLKAELRHGAEVAGRWAERLHTIEKVNSDGSSVPKDNDIIDAVYHVGQRISRHAETDQARDLGIVATGQIALHYYIAAFGTLRSYAQMLGLSDAASHLQQCLDEAKQEDEKHTRLAAAIGHTR